VHVSGPVQRRLGVRADEAGVHFGTTLDQQLHGRNVVRELARPVGSGMQECSTLTASASNRSVRQARMLAEQGSQPNGVAAPNRLHHGQRQRIIGAEQHRRNRSDRVRSRSRSR
jgi:hypothetical protein